MKYKNHPELRAYLKESRRYWLAFLPWFRLSPADFGSHMHDLQVQHSGLTVEQFRARAAYRCLTHRSKRSPWKWVLALIVILALVFLAIEAHAQAPNVKPCVATAAAPTYVEGTASFISCDLAGGLRTVGGGGGSNAAAGTTGAAVPGSASYTGVNIGGNLIGLTGFSLTNSKAVAVGIVDGAGTQITSFGGGTQYADGTTQATPTGTASLGKNPSNILHALALDASGNLLMNLNTAIPAGTAVIGHVIADSGSTTAVTGTVSDNITQFGGTNVSTGTGTGGVGIPRVTVSSDSFPATQAVSGTVTANAGTGQFNVTCTAANCPVNVSQVAATALGVPQTFGTVPSGVVLGTSSDIYAAGTRARSNQTTTAAGVLDVNVVGSLGVTNSATNGTFARLTDNTTAVGVIAGTTALKTDMSSVAGTATVTAAAGVQKVGIIGNANGAMDAANNAAAPANVLMGGVLAVAQGTQPTAVTGGNVARTLSTTEGAQYVQLGNSNRFSCFVEAVTVTTQCQAAPGAGLRAYVMSVTISNEAATVQGADIVFGTGANCVTGTTALTHKMQMGTNATTTSPFIVAVNYPTPLLPTAANAICVRPTAATAFGATITGFIAP